MSFVSGCTPVEVTPRTLEQFFLFTTNVMIFIKRNLILGYFLLNTSILSSGDLLGAVPGPKTNCLLNLNKFLVTSQIFDCKMILERAYQDLCISP